MGGMAIAIATNKLTIQSPQTVGDASGTIANSVLTNAYALCWLSSWLLLISPTVLIVF